MGTEVKKELRRRIAVLRLLNRDELLEMPSASTEEVEIEDETTLFTTYIERHQDGRLLVLVRSDRHGLLGLITYGTTAGFWACEDAVIWEASEKAFAIFVADKKQWLYSV